MTHADLVQAATDLLAESWTPALWVDNYDAALASYNDRLLWELVEKLEREAAARNPLAA